MSSQLKQAEIRSNFWRKRRDPKHRSRWTLVIVSIVAVCSLVAGCGINFGTTADGKKQYRWKMTVTSGPTSTWFTAAEKLAEDLKTETNGRITLKVFASERLSAGEPMAGVEQLMDGTKDLSFNSPIIYAGINPKYGAVAAPFRFSSMDEGHAAMEGAGGEAYRKLLEEDGVHVLGYGESGMRQLTNSKRPIHSPEDMRGLKFRIPGFGLYTDFYRAVGANPTTMAFSEVFTSLQQGAIDGQENPIDIIYSADLKAVQPYLSIWNYSYDPLILGINKELFDSLSAEDQELVSRLGQEAAQFQMDENRKREESELVELKDSGMEVNTLTPEEIDAFKEPLTELYSKYRSVWGSELSNEFIPEGY